MALQSYSLAVGNLEDVDGKNYSVNTPVYVTNAAGVAQQLYRDIGGTIPIAQDGIDNQTDSNGEFTFFVEEGNWIVSAGGDKKTIYVVGPDYFNNQIESVSDSIIEKTNGVGVTPVIGDFTTGFTFTGINQAGTYNNGGTIEYYIFVGGESNLPHIVAPSTNPVGDSNYQKVAINSIDTVTGLRDELDNQDQRLQDLEFLSGNNPFKFGAKADGSDDTAALFNYWQDCLTNGTPFDISGGHEFTIQTANYTDGAVKSYFQTEENNGISVIFGASKIKIIPPVGQGQANLFDIKQTKGFKFDTISYEVDTARASAGDNVRAVIVRHGSSKGSEDIKGVSIKAVNGEGLLATTDLADYTLNGFDSAYRSKDIHILDINIDNSAMSFTFTNEYTGYGIACQLSGDNCVIERLVVNNIHRAVFAYGVRGLRVNDGEVTESNATTVNLGPFGSVEDCKIKLKLIQNTNLATDLVRIRPNELGTTNGGSLDIQGSRAHHMKNITLDLIETGDATSIDSGLEVNKSTGDGSDSVFNFKNIHIKLSSEYDNISRGMTLFDKAKVQNSTNMIVDGFTIEETTCNSNCRISLLENAAGNINVKNSHFTKSVICEYGSLSNAEPNEDNWIIFDNTIIGFTVSETGDYDTPVQFINGSRVATVVNSANTVPAQNKIFRDSYISDKFFSYKPRYGVYTNINNSSAMFNPDNPTSNLIGGASSIGSAATPKTVDLVAASNLSTNSDAEIYHEYFFGNSTFGRTTNNRVEIYVRAAGSSNWAVAHGFLISEGLGSAKDFTSKDFTLTINNVVNVGSGGYLDSDFSLAVVDADTLRFSCSRASQDIAVSIYDN